MHLFRRDGNKILARLTQPEIQVLAAYFQHLRAIVLGEVVADDDGTDLLERVFPSASRDDPLVAREFAEMTLDGLRKEKHERLMTLSSAFASRRVVLSLEEADEIARALADARLITAAKCGIDEAVDYLAAGPGAEVNDDHSFNLETYRVLTLLQSTLIDALMSPPDPVESR
ncbi:MAG: DUF2017 family protein [Micrococcales bacterium]|nr:DUF2017 family protein [Micrococcales bacterium]